VVTECKRAPVKLGGFSGDGQWATPLWCSVCRLLLWRGVAYTSAGLDADLRWREREGHRKNWTRD
jgi:hypothetical protein